MKKLQTLALALVAMTAFTGVAVAGGGIGNVSCRAGGHSQLSCDWNWSDSYQFDSFKLCWKKSGNWEGKCQSADHVITIANPNHYSTSYPAYSINVPKANKEYKVAVYGINVGEVKIGTVKATSGK